MVLSTATHRPADLTPSNRVTDRPADLTPSTQPASNPLTKTSRHGLDKNISIFCMIRCSNARFSDNGHNPYARQRSRGCWKWLIR